MQTVRIFTVVPELPERLEGLRTLAYNLWWTWHTEAIELFQRLDPKLWELCQHNPVLMLGRLEQQTLNSLAEDEAFVTHLDTVMGKLQEHLTAGNWLSRQGKEPVAEGLQIAYFSAEFGLTEVLPLYSGGLGLLSGDHLKAASDMGLPMVAVGLLYREGYFHQYLSADGWQHEKYPENDFYNLPILPVRDEAGKQLRISVRCGQRDVLANVWQVNVGNIVLYMLDTNVSENTPADRSITSRLYGGDRELRIRQEIILGIGGVRMLEALGIKATVFHMNEGHSAFLALERIRRLMETEKVNFTQASQAAAAGNVFTTHTPVPAGNDMFSPDLMSRYFADYAGLLNLNWEQFLGLGRQEPQNNKEDFCMTVLALRLANYVNGVSALHGKVSRKMWGNVFPSLPEDEVPIISITNGVHSKGWLSSEMNSLFNRYLGPHWAQETSDSRVWKRVEDISSGELWRTHERRRERLVAFVRQELRRQLERRGAGASELAQATEVLDPEVLTIGLARRFASYKRCTLLLRDVERLRRILLNKERPVQIIIAGKAHPCDNAGKELIRDIIRLAQQDDFRHHVVFLEDYDINIARYMVQGVDVWLNTPRRPMEASGTSGMKAAVNGALNFSVLDGWWCEAYSPEIGWAIGHGEEYFDHDYQDQVESEAIYNILEREIIPLFYDRGPAGLPNGWMDKMKKAMSVIPARFNTARMIQEYTQLCYLPAHQRWIALSGDHLARSSALLAWRERIESQWPNVAVRAVHAQTDQPLLLHEQMPVRVEVDLGQIDPVDVKVQLYCSPLDTRGRLGAGDTTELSYEARLEDNAHAFTGAIRCPSTGRYGFAVRILPNHPDLTLRQMQGLILWA
ncbi:MAG: alpha-glucan family phosphorylase [Actinobacteria bacterium]|nr:alpha-glucan family phosphorylase [Actinomycetota bacterium]